MSDDTVSTCCGVGLVTKKVHSLDYDKWDSTSIVSTYAVTTCLGCGRSTERVLLEERRGMEERLPIDPEVISPPAFVRRLPWHFIRGAA